MADDAPRADRGIRRRSCIAIALGGGGYLLLTVSVWSMLTSTYQYMCTRLNSMGRGTSSFKHVLFLVKGDSYRHLVPVKVSFSYCTQ